MKTKIGGAYFSNVSLFMIGLLITYGLFGMHNSTVAMAVTPDDELQENNTAEEPAQETEAIEDDLFPTIDIKEETEANDTAAPSTMMNAEEGVYIHAEKFNTVTAPTSSDAFLAGNRISITDVIGGDLFAAGNTINVYSDVSGSVRLAGSAVTIDHTISGNALIFAQTVHITKNGHINGHANIYAKTIVVDGEIKGASTFAAEYVYVAGRLNTSIDITADRVRLDSGAELHSEGYTSRISTEKMSIDSAATGTEHIVYTTSPGHKRTEHEAQEKLEKLHTFLFAYFILGAVGIIFILLWPKKVDSVVETMQENPRQTLKTGLLFFLLIPAIALFLLFTLIGIPFSIVLLVLYCIALWIGQLAVGLWLGHHIVNEERIKDRKKQQILCFVIGYFVLSMLMSLDWVGWIFCVIAAIWGLGGLIESCKHKKKMHTTHSEVSEPVKTMPLKARTKTVKKRLPVKPKIKTTIVAKSSVKKVKKAK